MRNTTRNLKNRLRKQKIHNRLRKEAKAAKKLQRQQKSA
jgi:hypothetical protein